MFDPRSVHGFHIVVEDDSFRPFVIAYRRGGDPRVHQVPAAGSGPEVVADLLRRKDPSLEVLSVVDVAQAFEALGNQSAGPLQ